MAIFLAPAVWAQQVGSNSTSVSLPPSAAQSQGAPAETHPITLTPDEWQELRAARTSALQANPDLIEENRRLSDKMRDLAGKIDAAMIKSDPTLAPIIAKLEAGRQHLEPPTRSSTTTLPPQSSH